MKTQYKHLLQRTYLVLVFGFMYLPIAVLIAYSFNENKSRAVFQILGAVLSAWCSCPFPAAFSGSPLRVFAGYPMQTVIRFSRFNWCLAGNLSHFQKFF